MRKFHNAVDLQVLAVLFEEEVLELVFFLVIIRQTVLLQYCMESLRMEQQYSAEVIFEVELIDIEK